MKKKNTLINMTFCRLQKFPFLLWAILFFSHIAVAGDDVRSAVVAGQFYSNDPIQLARDIDDKLQAAPSGLVKGDILGLVVPHAGYQYSAAVAATGYKQVAESNYDIIVIIAPSHRDPFQGATIFPGSAYETPLGHIHIDKRLASALVESCDAVQFSEYGHRTEHAVEVQLPFIQTLFPKTKIIPIVVGRYDWPMCENIGLSLARVLKKKRALIVASTDLYHGDSYADCKRISGETLSAARLLQPQKLCEGLLRQEYQACGGGPVVVMQVAARELGATSAMILDRTNSNDVVGKKGGYVVGYGAVAVYQSTTSQSKSDRIEFAPLDKKTQIELIKMARASIDYYLEHQNIPDFESTTDVMLEKRGVFVTITENGYLRGCIGHHESNVPLYKLVPQMAVAAGFQDPRFPPLQPQEMDNIKIKVSVYLTNVYKIESIDEFEMGVHGIIMRKGRHAATYLPEVPVEAGWKTVDEEMMHLCQKAGLPSGGWKNGAEFWVYRTQVFDESILVD